MNKVIRMIDFERKTVENNSLILLGADQTVLWFINPLELHDQFDESTIEAAYQALPKTLRRFIAEIRAAKIAPNYQDSIQESCNTLEKICSIMEQSIEMEFNENLPLEFRESIRNESVAHILALRSSYQPK